MNPYVEREAAAGRAKTARKGAGLVENDLRDCARVLQNLREAWADDESLNCQSCDALAGMLREIGALCWLWSVSPCHVMQCVRTPDNRGFPFRAAAEGPDARRGGRAGIDVLVTGVESSLWVGEQFASNLQNAFPHLRVTAISANKARARAL